MAVGNLLHNKIVIFRIVIIFSLVFLGFHTAYESSRDTMVETVLIDKLTVLPSASIINWVGLGEQVEARQHQIISSSTRLSVLNGCEGLESIFLIIAAVLSFPASLSRIFVGLLFGVTLLYTVNQLRIVALYFALRSDTEIFSLLHGFIAPVFIILIGFLYFVWWSSWAGAEGR